MKELKYETQGGMCLTDCPYGLTTGPGHGIIKIHSAGCFNCKHNRTGVGEYKIVKCNYDEYIASHGGKMIIHISEDVPHKQAIDALRLVINSDLISDTSYGPQYCFLTLTSGNQVSCRKYNNGTYRFDIRRK